MGAWDSPPSSGGFFGCIAAAAGLVLLLTGGLCAFAHFSTGRVTLIGLIGLGMVALGWMLMRRR